MLNSPSQNNGDNSSNPLCVLIIMDGLGIREGKVGNAVLSASTPALDALWTQCPHALLKAAGKEVGLSQGDPGNSEVGHINIGSGQIIYQSQPRIDEYIRLGKLDDIPAMESTFKHVKKEKSDMHLVGLLSATGVHAHIEHLFELMQICKKNNVDPYIHVILDGRDTGLKDGYLYLNMLKGKIHELGIGRIASVSGRRFSMDRDHRWERTEEGYNAMIGKGKRTATDPIERLQRAYAKDENDQIFSPTTIVDESANPIGIVKDNDAVIFYNYREDRARQLTKAFVEEDFDGFQREKIQNLHFLTMTGYEKDLPVEVLFEPFIINNTIASIVSDAGMKQVHISETEKYAHVTYFFNGGHEEEHEGEKFINVPSPKVFDYVEVPEMNAAGVRDEAIKAIKSGENNFVMMNFANPDMLGHTGNLEKTIKAVEITDECVRDVVNATIEMKGKFIITADHGNCEEMVDEVTGELNTAHTINPVPIIICTECTEIKESRENLKIGTGKGAVARGILADIAPTVLGLLGLKPKGDMTGIDLMSVKF